LRYIFIAPSLVNYMIGFLFSGTTEVFIDATFASRPHHNIFSQLLNVLVMYKGYAVHVMHVLMTCKEQGLYMEVIGKFKDLAGPNYNPTHTMSDYERAIMNVLGALFPNSRVAGCRFHFSQAGIYFL
jgi:hypothetical protein